MAKSTLKSAVLYMGTGCKRGNMEKIKRTIKEFSPTTEVEIYCWTNDPDLVDLPLDYTLSSRYNIQGRPGDWSLAVGHSAGGFPLKNTRAYWKVGINPPYTKYSGKNWTIFRATKDWLVPVELQATFGLFDTSRIQVYKGKHSTMPIQKFRELLEEKFEPRGSSSALDFKIPSTGR